MSTVIVEPVNAKLYSNSNLEPQYFTYRTPNTAILYLDSQDNILELDKTNIQLSSIIGVGDKPSILANGINRIGIPSAAIYYNTPNINIRNNTITFFSSNSSQFHTVNVVEGFYTSANNVMTALVNALNTVTGSSGLTFSSAPIIGFPTTFLLNSAGGDYYFKSDCSAILKGYQLWNLPIDQTLSNSKRVGSIDLYYTRYVDICCLEVVKYAKIKTVTTSRSQDVVIRLFIDDATYPHIIPRLNLPNISYNFLSNEPIYTLNFRLVDQFGDPLYIPNPSTNGGGFFWDIQLLISI